MKILIACAVVLALASTQNVDDSNTTKEETMELGAFSTSLAVKDIPASRAFYEKLGFKEAGGNVAQNWLILRNGDTTIGLFQGMFESNIMTFNPGWGKLAQPLEEFTDVRELERLLKEKGMEFVSETDDSKSGPANFILMDPDGNTIYFDQHVD